MNELDEAANDALEMSREFLTTKSDTAAALCILASNIALAAKAIERAILEAHRNA